MNKELTKDVNPEWASLFENEPQGIDRIVYLFGICKETDGGDWEHNKKRLKDIIAEYADQQSKKKAIAFAEWKYDNGYVIYKNGGVQDRKITTEQLYQLYCSQVVTPLKGE